MERRKVIKQGKGTLTMSLPMKWVKHVGLREGSEIFVDQKGLQLLVSPTTGTTPAKKTDLDLRAYDNALVNIILYNLYVRGDDDIRIKVKDRASLDQVEKSVRDLPGFQIIARSGTTCTIASLAHGHHEELDVLIRRALLLLVGIAEEGHHALLTKDSATLAVISKRENTVDSLIRYCLRTLNRSGSGDIQHLMHLYALLNLLEQLGDQYARMYREVSRLSQPVIAINGQVCKLLRSFYELFYSFDPAKACMLREDRDAIRKKIDTCLAGSSNKQDLLSLHHLRTIADVIVDIEKFQIAMQV